MLCSLVGAGSWLLMASRMGMPVSTTHSIIGALLGFGLATGNPAAIQWSSVLRIVISWAIAPVAAALASMLLFTLIRATILRRRNPLRKAKFAVPVFMFLVSLSFSVFLVFKNPFSLSSITCTMINRNGVQTTTSPCQLSAWASAHRGTAFGTASGLAVVFAAAICWLVYGLAARRTAHRKKQNGGDQKERASRALGYKLRSEEHKMTEDHPCCDDTAAGANCSSACHPAAFCNAAEHGVEMPPPPPARAATEVPPAVDVEEGGDSCGSSVLEAPLSSLGSLSSSPSLEEQGWLKGVAADGQGGKMDWKARMRTRAHDKWNNMPWFKDLHTDGCEGDAVVGSIQHQAEVFDENTEILFSCCQIISSSLGCLAHSANDTANAIGPFAAILTIYTKGLDERVHVDWYVLMCGGLSMAAGLAMMGYRVIQTMGVKMVKITPPRGFSVELGSAWVVLLFSYLGIPLSTTHCAVGSTLGVGLSEPKRETVPFREGLRQCPPVLPFINTAAVNWRLFGSVFISWIGTVVFSCLVCMAVFAFSAYAPSVKCEVHK
eukprot:GHVS01078207.1.p1 GENE.GHVS01078207.1~~GHVS01078207.1.p1  ORF type:complete len:608 (-),score=109.27 GHVS01078207.1:283-1926(-)